MKMLEKSNKFVRKLFRLILAGLFAFTVQACPHNDPAPAEPMYGVMAPDYGVPWVEEHPEYGVPEVPDSMNIIMDTDLNAEDTQ